MRTSSAKSSTLFSSPTGRNGTTTIALRTAAAASAERVKNFMPSSPEPANTDGFVRLERCNRSRRKHCPMRELE